MELKITGLKVTIQLFNTFDTKVRKRFTNVLNKHVNSFLAEIKLRSPVDSGEYKKAWKKVLEKATGNLIASYSLVNDKIYAKVLEEGSRIGSRPWPNPGPRTMVYAGRIFSSQAPGGVSRKTITDERINSILNDLTKEVEKLIGNNS